MFANRTNWNLETNQLSQALSRHRDTGEILWNLTASNPTECGFDYDQQAILQALSNPAALLYQPEPKGIEAARTAISGYYASHNHPVQIEDIILTTSTSEAYSFLFRALCDPGDEVLIPEPSYPLFGFLADIQDVKCVPYPLVYASGWQIDFPSLEKALTPRSRCVIVVHPNNPTGHFCKAHELARLNEICIGRKLALIADEVFLDFALSEIKPPSFVANTAALTFTMSGLSKISGLPQMKASWLVASGPEELKRPALNRLELIADTYLSMNAPTQLALPVFLDQRHSFQTQLMERVRKNLAHLDRTLASSSSCARLRLEGGWYAVLRVPATSSDEDTAVKLLTTKNVYIHPGYFYDFPADGYLVVSLMTPEKDFAQGTERLLSMF